MRDAHRGAEGGTRGAGRTGAGEGVGVRARSQHRRGGGDYGGAAQGEPLPDGRRLRAVLVRVGRRWSEGHRGRDGPVERSGGKRGEKGNRGKAAEAVKRERQAWPHGGQ